MNSFIEKNETHSNISLSNVTFVVGLGAVERAGNNTRIRHGLKKFL